MPNQYVLFVCFFAFYIIHKVDSNCIPWNRNISLTDVPPTNLTIEAYSEGVITSPDYRESFFAKYPLRTICAWNITVSPGSLIQLEFDEFILQACYFDILQIFDGNNANSSSIQILCGRMNPEPIISKGNSLYLVFLSDEEIAYRGFKLRFKIPVWPKSCGPNEFTCRNKNCVRKSKVCDKIDDCGDGTDEENCKYKTRLKPRCGRPRIKPKIDFQTRIIGGQPAEKGSWPWQVQLTLQDKHACGGSLINHEWIVTAAHCFRDNPNITSWKVYLGKYMKYRSDQEQTTRYIKRIISHPYYLPLIDEVFANRKDNDIALIKLNAPVLFNNYIHPICLPDFRNEDFTINKSCFITGWGNTGSSGNDDRLRQAEIPIADPIKCLKNYAPLKSYVIVPDIMICGGFDIRNQDACKGDSGGPLAINLRRRWYLLGVVSSGGDNGCGQPGLYGLYTKVYRYFDWIKKTIQEN